MLKFEWNQIRRIGEFDFLLYNNSGRATWSIPFVQETHVEAERERMCCCAWLNSHQLVIFIHMLLLNQMGCNQWANLKIADIICMCAMCVYLCVIIWQSGVQQSMNIVELFTRFLRFDFRRNSLRFVVLPSGND